MASASDDLPTEADSILVGLLEHHLVRSHLLQHFPRAARRLLTRGRSILGPVAADTEKRRVDEWLAWLRFSDDQQVTGLRRLATEMVDNWLGSRFRGIKYGRGPEGNALQFPSVDQGFITATATLIALGEKVARAELDLFEVYLKYPLAFSEKTATAVLGAFAKAPTSLSKEFQFTHFFAVKGLVGAGLVPYDNFVSTILDRLGNPVEESAGFDLVRDRPDILDSYFARSPVHNPEVLLRIIRLVPGSEQGSDIRHWLLGLVDRSTLNGKREVTRAIRRMHWSVWRRGEFRNNSHGDIDQWNKRARRTGWKGGAMVGFQICVDALRNLPDRVRDLRSR